MDILAVPGQGGGPAGKFSWCPQLKSRGLRGPGQDCVMRGRDRPRSLPGGPEGKAPCPGLFPPSSALALALARSQAPSPVLLLGRSQGAQGWGPTTGPGGKELAPKGLPGWGTPRSPRPARPHLPASWLQPIFSADLGWGVSLQDRGLPRAQDPAFWDSQAALPPHLPAPREAQSPHHLGCPATAPDPLPLSQFPSFSGRPLPPPEHVLERNPFPWQLPHRPTLCLLEGGRLCSRAGARPCLHDRDLHPHGPPRWAPRQTHPSPNSRHLWTGRPVG